MKLTVARQLAKGNVLMQDQVELGRKILEARKKKSLSQEALAEISNVSLSSIQRIEKGTVSPRAFTLKTLAETLDLPISELLSDISISEDSVDDMSLIKRMNLSTLVLILFPFLNILFPYYIWKKNKTPENPNSLAGKIVSFQIIWTIVMLVIIILTPFVSYLITGLEGYRPFPVELFIYIILVMINLAYTLKFAIKLSQNELTTFTKIPNFF